MSEEIEVSAVQSEEIEAQPEMSLNVEQPVIEFAAPQPTQEYQQRVMAEKEELDAKKNKLGEFMESDTFKQLEGVDQGHLHSQYIAMTQYSVLLGQRISRFPK